MRKCRVLRWTEKWVLNSEKSVDIASGVMNVVAFLCGFLPSWMSDERKLLIKLVRCKKSSLTVVVAIALYLQLKIAFQL